MPNRQPRKAHASKLNKPNRRADAKVSPKTPPSKSGEGTKHYSLNVLQQVFDNPEFIPPGIIEQYSPETREWVKKRVEEEQQARHRWAFKEQGNRHDYNLRELDGDRMLRLAGMLTAAVLSVVAIVSSAIMLIKGMNLVGIIFFLAGVGLLIGTAIHKKNLTVASGSSRAGTNDAVKRKSD